ASSAAGSLAGSDAIASVGGGAAGATGTTRLGFGRGFAGAPFVAGAGGGGISVRVADRTTSSGDLGGSTGHSDQTACTRIDNKSAIHSERRTRNRSGRAMRRAACCEGLVASVAINDVDLC